MAFVMHPPQQVHYELITTVQFRELSELLLKFDWEGVDAWLSLVYEHGSSDGSTPMSVRHVAMRMHQAYNRVCEYNASEWRDEMFFAGFWLLISKWYWEPDYWHGKIANLAHAAWKQHKQCTLVMASFRLGDAGGSHACSALATQIAKHHKSMAYSTGLAQLAEYQEHKREKRQK